MNNLDAQYKALFLDVWTNGFYQNDRTGVGSKSLFNKSVIVDLRDGFPILTFRKMSFNIALNELHLFLKGSSDITELQNKGISIWDKHNIDGDIGYAYGKLWRDFNGFDQLKFIVKELKAFPQSRRLFVSGWEPSKFSVLPSCVTTFQFTYQAGRVNLSVNARSTDLWNGFGYDIMSMGLLLHVVCNLTNKEPGILAFNMTYPHLYLNGESTYIKVEENFKASEYLPGFIIPKLESLEDPEILNCSLFNYVHDNYKYKKVPIAV